MGGALMEEGQTECQSRHVATPVCNEHLYPSSLATASAHCICLSTPSNAQGYIHEDKGRTQEHSSYLCRNWSGVLSPRSCTCRAAETL